MEISKVSSNMMNLSPIKSESETKENGLSFNKVLETVNGIERNQVDTQNSVYTLLTTGEGSTQEMLIAMQKATSQIKTAAVVRDKLVEAYQSIMNTQI